MKALIEKKCQGCEGEANLLSFSNIQNLLTKIPNWSLDSNKKVIIRAFYFKNHYQTIDFVNRVAWLSHQENHHPDLMVGFNKCVVQYSTHALNGLSENDFICAAKISSFVS